MTIEQITRWLLVLSVITIILAPVILIMGAFSPSSILMSIALFIMGALGLFAGMKRLPK